MVHPPDEHPERDVVGDVQDAHERLRHLLTLESVHAPLVLHVARGGFEEHPEEQPRQYQDEEAEQGNLAQQEGVLGGERLPEELPTGVEVEPLVGPVVRATAEVVCVLGEAVESGHHSPPGPTGPSKSPVATR